MFVSEFSDLEGASGYTPRVDEVKLRTLDSPPEDDNMNEMRRRRLQHFTSQHSNSKASDT